MIIVVVVVVVVVSIFVVVVPIIFSSRVDIYSPNLEVFFLVFLFLNGNGN